MRLDELNPVVRVLTSELYELAFDCPTCNTFRILIPFRIGSPSVLPPRCWGSTTDDPKKMTLSPSVSNSLHGRVHCIAHVVIENGNVEIR